ncbi:MAG: glycosyltransferase [Nitrospira sp.]|nr:glycosyltransferase [Nitrospira sp.]
MHLSIVIPAFNEERLIESCLKSISASCAESYTSGLTTEIIVVDNNSTDQTARLAREAGAHVVFEPINQIGRARNTGAAAATGDWLLFLDADSALSPELLLDVLVMIEEGKNVGCGSTLSMDGLPWWANGIFHLWRRMSVTFQWAAGALIVCRRDAFEDVGGFPIDIYALEEIELSKRLKKWGRKRGLRFAILSEHPLYTSSRKITLYSPREIASQILRVFLSRRRTLRDKRHLSVWYDGRR